MDLSLINKFVDVIELEESRLRTTLSTIQEEAADDCWLFVYEPFLARLYLLVLVFTWHDVEKELICLAARADNNLTTEIKFDEYRRNVEDLSGKTNSQKWVGIEQRLPIKRARQYNICRHTLRKLANSYKHQPFGRPTKDLIKELNLNADHKYAPHAESGELRAALCRKLGLAGNAGYAEICAEFVRRCDEFLTFVKAESRLRSVEPMPGSFNPDDLEG